MCKNCDLNVPDKSPAVEPDRDYSEVTAYDRDDASDYSDFYDVAQDLLETVGQAIADACSKDSDEDDEKDEDDSSEEDDG